MTRGCSKNETLVQALVMAVCCLASGCSFSVGVRKTGVGMSAARIVRTRGCAGAAWTGCRRHGRAGGRNITVACSGDVHVATLLPIGAHSDAVVLMHRPTAHKVGRLDYSSNAGEREVMISYRPTECAPKPGLEQWSNTH